VDLILPIGFSAKGYVATEIFNPSDELKGNFSISANKNISAGTYPAVIFIKYRNENMNTFSTLYPHLLTYKNRYCSKIQGSISDLEMTGKHTGITTLKIINYDNESHKIKINLYFPIEIKNTSCIKEILLGPRQEEEINLEINAFRVIMGRAYKILASLEYDENGRHFSSFATGIVRVNLKISEGEEQNYVLWGTLWGTIILFIILLVIYIYYSFTAKNKRL